MNENTGFIKYQDWAPTPFDTKGAFLPDRSNWVVLPVYRTRDSCLFEMSNFETALSMLGGESDAVEVHRFGHWGPGWVEIIIVDPSQDLHISKVYDIVKALEDYPLLDEDDFSEREYTEACDVWSMCYSWRGRVNYIRNFRSQFHGTWLDLLANVRGNLFSGYPGELLS